MNKTTENLICLALTLLIVVPALYFPMKKQSRLRKMSPEDRKMMEVRKAIWLQKNSFGAVMYKIGWFILQASVVAHIYLETSNCREILKLHRLYNDQFAIFKATINKRNRLEVSLYSGKNEVLNIYSCSDHPESLEIETWIDNKWESIQTSTPISECHPITHTTVYTEHYILNPPSTPFRVGIPWSCEKTGESGIVWSNKINPPRKVSKGK